MIEDIKKCKFFVDNYNLSKNIIRELCQKGENDFPFLMAVGSNGETKHFESLEINSEKDKILNFYSIGSVMAEDSFEECFLFFDSYIMEFKDKSQAEYVKENWDIEGPHAYPKSMRMSVLCAMYLNFKERNGMYTSTSKYKIEDKKVTIYDIDGSFNCSSTILDYVKAGFLCNILLNSYSRDQYEDDTKRCVAQEEIVGEEITAAYRRVLEDYVLLDTEFLRDMISLYHRSKGDGMINGEINDI